MLLPKGKKALKLLIDSHVAKDGSKRAQEVHDTYIKTQPKATTSRKQTKGE